ncbi:MAG: hypothetical protein IJK23_09545 [Clostridia bacterium]|nr:hypothetical protein [Clostridia bacterium]
MKRIIKLILLNLSIAAGAVIAYSDGLLGLRPSDPSILRAGFSIIIGLALTFALVYGNFKLLREPKMLEKEELTNPDQVEALLKEFTSSSYFGTYARTSIDQLRRLAASARRTAAVIKVKFQTGSMSFERYMSIIESAGATAIDNIRNVAMRMQMFDDAEYRRLKNYKSDTIPDEIQQKQLELYDRNTQFIKNSIAVNEELILKMDTLALEISDSSSRNENDADELLEEITKLTSELKYYK